MIPVKIPNRPFSTETFTGLMLPDGIFESSLGAQRLNAQFQNTSGGALAGVEVYVESVSNPGIVVTPNTHLVGSLPAGAARTLSWDVNVGGAPAGVHYVSFIVRQGAQTQRLIKKIFVTRVSFDPTTRTFTAETPEGTISARYFDPFGPKGGCCGDRKRDPHSDVQTTRGRITTVEGLAAYVRELGGNFRFCTPFYLPNVIESAVIPVPPYGGQYGDLPFQDPWWKILLCIIAILLLIAAAIAEAVGGSGDVTVTHTSGAGSEDRPCCGVGAEGGGTSYVAAGLVAAAAAVATIAAASDIRDPFRRGEDNTPPGRGELTTHERLKMKFEYPEPVALGKPFKIGLKWAYERQTTGGSYSYSAEDLNQNLHVSTYEIKAPDVVRRYKREPFIVHARFLDANGKEFRGSQLFVQCFLVGPSGQWFRLLLQDDGVTPDEKANDAIYTTIHYFTSDEEAGIWKYYVIAQDVNHATPDMKPEEAAQIIGGMVITHQLTINFDGGTCPFVPDGDVHVI